MKIRVLKNIHFLGLWLAQIGMLIFLVQCTTTNPVDVENATKISHFSRITKNETWRANQVHVVTQDVILDNCLLTIEAGARIEFLPNTSLQISTNAAVRAVGTEQDSIIFTANDLSKGAWKNVRFGFDCLDSLCQFSFCIFESGGIGDSLAAMIVCEDAAPAFENSSIRKSVTNGISLLGESRFKKFQLNKVSNNRMAPLLLPANAVASLNSTSQFSGNPGVNAVRVIRNGDVTQSGTWSPLDVPYRFDVDVRIMETQLTIKPGVQMEFDIGKSFEVGYKARLIAKGEMNLPVKFNGKINQPGYWEGILLRNGSSENSQFAFCRVADGGSNLSHPANVYCETGSPAFENCEFTNSGGYGIIFNGESYPTLFEFNKFLSNKNAPIRMTPAVFGKIRYNQFDMENYFIEVTAGTLYKGGTIPNSAIPYRLTGNLNIYYQTVTIEPGVVFELGNDVNISVSARGGLIARGNIGLPILFTGSVKSPGYWDFIYFGNDCAVESCVLENCIIEYGGGSLSWPANIYCEGSSPTIKNCQVNYSGHWGIFRSNFARPDITGTIFMGNRDGDLWP